jgi:hypothetical protein
VKKSGGAVCGDLVIWSGKKEKRSGLWDGKCEKELVWFPWVCGRIEESRGKGIFNTGVERRMNCLDSCSDI